MIDYIGVEKDIKYYKYKWRNNKSVGYDSLIHLKRIFLDPCQCIDY